MPEWRLFPEGTIPDYTTAAFFAAHPWVDPADQRGHAQRTDLVADLVTDIVDEYQVDSITDLGCGDGSLLEKISQRVPVKAWGYDLGEANLEVAVHKRGVDARRGDILTDELAYGDLLVATEVLEHLYDPYRFVASLPGRLLVCSSPYNETDRDHYVHHAFAWDEPGYRTLLETSGWVVLEQRRCREGFQAVFGVRHG